MHFSGGRFARSCTAVRSAFDQIAGPKQAACRINSSISRDEEADGRLMLQA
jgi:hypothetical protein